MFENCAFVLHQFANHYLRFTTTPSVNSLAAFYYERWLEDGWCRKPDVVPAEIFFNESYIGLTTPPSRDRILENARKRDV